MYGNIDFALMATVMGRLSYTPRGRPKELPIRRRIPKITHIFITKVVY